MSVISSRYARAFADVVFSSKLDPATTIAEVEQFVEMTSSSPELDEVFVSPSIPHDQKLHLLDALVSRTGASRSTRNFLAVLIDHHRIHQLREISQQFKTEISDRLGFAEAEVVTARELGGDEKREMEAHIAKLTGKTVRAHYSLDPKMLGGATVRIGSTIYDGSVLGQLQRVKAQIAAS